MHATQLENLNCEGRILRSTTAKTNQSIVSQTFDLPERLIELVFDSALLNKLKQNHLQIAVYVIFRLGTV